MTMKFHDPRGQAAVESEPYTLAVDLSQKGAAQVAFLANGFPDSVEFLEQVDLAMGKLLPDMSSRHWNKGDASSAARPEMLEQIEGSCGVAVVAYGH